MVEFRKGKAARAELSTYRAADFSLEYRHPSVVRAAGSTLANQIDEALGAKGKRPCLMLADTLTIVFAGEAHELVAFDAYTNCGQWVRMSGFTLPRVCGVGRIGLIRPLPEGRLDLALKPAYAYSEAESTLVISLKRAPEATYYRVSDRLVVGVIGGELSELVLQGLEMT